MHIFFPPILRQLFRKWNANNDYLLSCLRTTLHRFFLEVHFDIYIIKKGYYNKTFFIIWYFPFISSSLEKIYTDYVTSNIILLLFNSKVSIYQYIPYRYLLPITYDIISRHWNSSTFLLFLYFESSVQFKKYQ